MVNLVYKNKVDTKELKRILENDKIFNWFEEKCCLLNGALIEKFYLAGGYVLSKIYDTEYNDVDIFCLLPDDNTDDLSIWKEIVKKISNQVFGKDSWAHAEKTQYEGLYVINKTVSELNDQKVQLIFRKNDAALHFDFKMLEVFVDTDLEITGIGLNESKFELTSNDHVYKPNTQKRLVKYAQRGFTIPSQMLDKFIRFETEYDDESFFTEEYRTFNDETLGYLSLIYDHCSKVERIQLQDRISPVIIAKMRMWKKENPKPFKISYDNVKENVKEHFLIRVV